MQTIKKVQRQINPSLKVDGVLLTLADMRTNLARATETSLKENYGRFIKVYQTVSGCSKGSGDKRCRKEYLQL